MCLTAADISVLSVELLLILIVYNILVGQAIHTSEFEVNMYASQISAPHVPAALLSLIMVHYNPHVCSVHGGRGNFIWVLR